jgi:hypothetical protein
MQGFCDRVIPRLAGKPETFPLKRDAAIQLSQLKNKKPQHYAGVF